MQLLKMFKKKRSDILKNVTAEEVHNEINSIPGIIYKKAEEEGIGILNDKEKTAY